MSPAEGMCDEMVIDIGYSNLNLCNSIYFAVTKFWTLLDINRVISDHSLAKFLSNETKVSGERRCMTIVCAHADVGFAVQK